MSQVGLIYSLVARGSTVLAEFTTTSGNFTTVTRRILDKISPDPQKMSYIYDRYIFHYVVEDGLVYLCMADEEFGRRIPFAFLEDVKSNFKAQYGDKSRTALAYAMNDEFSRTLEKKMQYFNTNPNADKINAVRSQIDDVKNTMVTNIEKVLERGEKIELLVDKTETLNQQAFAFKKKATHLKRLMWWQNFKLQLIIFLIVAVVIFIISLVACGGFTFPKCKSKKSDNKPKPQASQTPEPNHNKTATYQLLSAVLDHI